MQVDVLGLTKRGPKTDPNAPHNKAIREWGQEIINCFGNNAIIAGGGVAKEILLTILNGHKTGRRPDIIWKDNLGNINYGNVGRTNRKGRPVKREIEAMQDLNNYRKKQNLKGRTQFRSFRSYSNTKCSKKPCQGYYYAYYRGNNSKNTNRTIK